jgi:hypothetical protein
MENSDKIPSVISYSPRSTGNEQQWGASLSPDAVAMVNTKIGLDLHDVSEELDLIIQALDGMKDLGFENIKASQGLPEYPWKSPEEIVTDYLTKVFQYVLQSIDVFSASLGALLPIDIVMTMPTVCFSPLDLISKCQYWGRGGHTELKTQRSVHCHELEQTRRTFQDWWT